MPSQNVLDKKKAIVADLTEKLKISCTGVLVDYKGITVAKDTKLRKELREAGVEYSVVKNTLLSYAADNNGLSELKSVLEGTTAMALSQNDYTIAAKILVKYSEESKGAFSIKAGFVDGNVIDAKGVTALSKLPPRDVLIAQVLGGLNTPITNFVGVLNANLRGLVCVLNAIAEKQTA